MTESAAKPEVPAFIYGTAWKEESTAALVTEALAAGFRAIDTANQRKHYYEAGVGEALRKAFGAGVVTRDALFLQTKFTFPAGQDERLPYDPGAPVDEQVRQSFGLSLEHLGVAHLDSLVLHGPSVTRGLAAEDHLAWRAMEALAVEGSVAALGVSNVKPAQLQALLEYAEVRPRYVQNRCYAARSWDADVRAICNDAGITYQGFSLLTANRHVLEHPEVQILAEEKGCTVPQLMFRFTLELGILPLTGTSSRQHMDEDLRAHTLSLSNEDIEAIWYASTGS